MLASQHTQRANPVIKCLEKLFAARTTEGLMPQLLDFFVMFIAIRKSIKQALGKHSWAYWVRTFLGCITELCFPEYL